MGRFGVLLGEVALLLPMLASGGWPSSRARSKFMPGSVLLRYFYSRLHLNSSPPYSRSLCWGPDW